MRPLFLLPLFLLPACSAPPAPEPAQEPAPAPGTLAYDRNVFTELLDAHQKIRRTVTIRPDGIEAVTESDDPAVAAFIQDHGHAMKARLESGRRLRQWDPLYVAVFDHARKITFTVTNTDKGIRAVETSTDPEVVRVIHQHARVVTGFVERGFEESKLAHPVDTTPSTPPHPTDSLK